MTQQSPAPRRNPRIIPHAALVSEIAGAWSSVLGVNRVRTDANFFDLGGSSLQVLQVKQHLDTALGLSVPVIDFFRYPTVAELANHLRKAASATNAPA
jgi:acyl carrier protein